MFNDPAPGSGILTFVGAIPTVDNSPGFDAYQFGEYTVGFAEEGELQVYQYGEYIAAYSDGTNELQVYQFGAYVAGSPATSFDVYQFGAYIGSYGDGELEVYQFGAYICGKVTPLIIPKLAEVEPEVPLLEWWNWWTDKIISDDGTEQRISLRSYPRKRFSHKYVLDGEDVVRETKRLLYKEIRETLAIPLPQYMTRLKAKAAAAAVALVFNIDRTDLRDGGWIVIKEGERYEFHRVDEVTSTGCTLQTALAAEFTTRAWVMPVAVCLVDNKPTMVQKAPNGIASLTLNANQHEFIEPFVRPSNTQVLTYLGDYPVLERRAVGDEFNDQYDTGREDVDYGGTVHYVVPWNFTKISGERTYQCNRILRPTDFDYWQVFADYCNGSVNPFFVPTFREDFNILDAPQANGDSFKVAGQTYSADFFDNPAFQQIMITSDAGAHYATITDVAPDGDDEVIVFTPALPNDIAWESNQAVCLLLKAHLASDEIALEHHALHTNISIAIQTVDL